VMLERVERNSSLVLSRCEDYLVQSGEEASVLQTRSVSMTELSRGIFLNPSTELLPLLFPLSWVSTAPQTFP
jgi:hypothetical protein